MSATLESLTALTPDEIAVLPEKDQRWIADTLDRELALASPAAFATRFSHGLWLPYRHLVATSDAIVGMIERDECDCLIVEEPVRHGKTELCSRWTPAWFVCKYRQRVLLTSYEADFAATHGRRAREIVSEVGSQFGIQIDDTSRAAHRWELVGGAGGMSCAGAGGPITGKGGNLLICDDPIKNSEEANSPVMREHLWQWWQSTFMTRREPGAKIILICSRWHSMDIVAQVIENETDMRVA